ncbi:putative tubulin polyglutamylase TTLL9 isoform X1 [Gouania willdenowi]|uniref:putative tubulin polyglutamylase TTLL9 isoform X1 n=1 Tax=Gouania willdenowi TaxID=441366 RepID=UPI00105573F1|nr:probable tubulin polyglutamylase TTLL9 isoform X1 [Gouania willdenowi]
MNTVMSKYKTSGVKGPGDNGKSEERKGQIVVRYRCNQPGTIQDVLRQRQNWVEVNDDEQWDFSWSDVAWLREIFDQVYLQEHVRMNHFRNYYELTRKNLMVKNLKHHQKNLKRDAGRTEMMCDFFPPTFSLPSEYHLFVEEFNRNSGSTWIMKPAARSQGKGIFLFRKLKDVMDWKKDSSRHSEEQGEEAQVENYVAQRYIAKPYLINGRKFDLRVYVLVTSYDPLKAWLYRDGFARFSCTRFSLSSIDDMYVHLTNVSVQKTAPDYDPKKGCKWSIQQLRRYLTAKHGKATVETLFQKMDTIFIHSLLSVRKVIINDKRCFELYGYDILLDHNLKPWLIEVNASPSHSPSSQEDYEMKCNMLDDTLNVVDMEGRLTGKEKRVGGYDLMWDDGPVFQEDVGPQTFGSSCLNTNTNLGCINDREKQLRQMPSRGSCNHRMHE